ncbi:hypothetical protein H0H87_001772 [Tephrocybe sp. NHM501043]|nr:hypothetical protein H0H87_001772 [Tephrocybe sp. NHM501043]
MGKGGGKSSATSATRKKHAKKSAGPSQEEQAAPIFKDKKLTKQQRAQKKKEPRVKVYIPPVKPAPVQPDPLETTGLVHSLPPELLIVLRSFNKKAQVTKIRALEELQSGWIDKCKKEGEDGALVYVLINMLPVWVSGEQIFLWLKLNICAQLHHVPALFVHPSRRVRLLAAGVHLSFIQISPVRDQILSFLRDSASASQIESILGTWCLAAHDIEKSVASTALKSWADVLTFNVSGQRDQLCIDDYYLSPLIAFVQRAILDPNGVYVYLNPPAPSAPAPPTKKGVRREEPEPARSKAEELEESDMDRKARLRIGGLGAIRRIVETLSTSLPDDLVNFFNNPALWSSLYPVEQCPFVTIESFGHAQHNVRKSAWGLILALLSAPKTQVESLLPILSVATLRSAWVDPDTTVHAVMWQPLLKFLKEFPGAWEIERSYDYSKDENGDEDSDSETSDVAADKPSTSSPLTKPATAYLEFLRFLELGCSGSPLQGYPTVVIILSTIPSCILASSPSVPPLSALFDSFWKVLNSPSPLLLGAGDTKELTKALAQEQFGRVWAHLAEGTLRVEQRAAARLVAQTLLSLKEAETGLFSAVWSALAAHLETATELSPVLLSVFLKVFHDKFKHTPEPKEAVSTLMSTTLNAAIQQCSKAFGATATGGSSTFGGVQFLVEMLDQFREGLFDDSQVAQLLDDLTTHHAFLILGASSPLLLAYLTHRRNEASCSQVWHVLLSGVTKNPENAELSIKPLLDATQRGILPQYLKPSAREVDDLIENLLAQALAGDAAQLAFVQQVLRTPDYFLSSKAYVAAMDSISSTFSSQVDAALLDPVVTLGVFVPSLGLITTLSHSPPRELPKFDISGILSDIFVLAYLIPACYESQGTHSAFSESRALWEEFHKALPAESQADVNQRINTKLGVILCATSLRP